MRTIASRPSTAKFTRARRGSIVLALTALVLQVACNSITGADGLSTSDTVSQEPRQADEAGTVGSMSDRAIEDSGTSPTSDSPDTSVTDADSAVRAKRVFVTTSRTSGNIRTGGIAGGDLFCTEQASGAKLGGTWIAWLSADGSNAIDRISYDGPYERLDGVRVVSNKSQLAAGGLSNPINVDQTGAVLNDSPPGVWTGTTSAGVASSTDCDGWTNGGTSRSGTAGYLGRTAADDWTQYKSEYCSVSLRILCFEQ